MSNVAILACFFRLFPFALPPGNLAYT